MKKFTLSISLTLLAWIGIETFSAISNAAGPPISNTGAPGETTCAQSGCHEDFALNSGSAKCQIAMADSLYDPANTGYNIFISLSASGNTDAGYQMTAVCDATGKGAGSFSAPTNTTMPAVKSRASDNRSYIYQTQSHDNHGSGFNTSFSWDAPATDLGTVTLYCAFNEANGNGQTDGDYIYTKKFTLWSPDALLGIKKNYNNPLRISVFPTVTNDYINLVSEKTYNKLNIQLVSSDGKNSYSFNVNNISGSEQISLPKGISTGLYFVKISSTENSYTTKILIN